MQVWAADCATHRLQAFWLSAWGLRSEVAHQQYHSAAAPGAVARRVADIERRRGCATLTFAGAGRTGPTEWSSGCNHPPCHSAPAGSGRFMSRAEEKGEALPSKWCTARPFHAWASQPGCSRPRPQPGSRRRASAAGRASAPGARESRCNTGHREARPWVVAGSWSSGSSLFRSLEISRVSLARWAPPGFTCLSGRSPMKRWEAGGGGRSQRASSAHRIRLLTSLSAKLALSSRAGPAGPRPVSRCCRRRRSGRLWQAFPAGV